MEKQLFEIICSKDEKKAQFAANELINNCDLQEFEKLCNKMDYLFDFVKDNVYRRIQNAINKKNYKNIIFFFKCYSPYFDDLFATVLSEYANEDLTDEILEILSSGNISEKTYAASYFKKIPDTAAIDDLKENLEIDNDSLFENSAAALGRMKDTASYDNFFEKLNSYDEFEQLKAVKFLISYGDKKAINPLINTMKSSSMSENIAGEITMLVSPTKILNENFQNGILLANNLVNGLGEILPLENIFLYEIYEITDFMLKNSQKPEAALILYNLKNKFFTFTQNDEYIFDLDKEIKNEIFEIKELLSKTDEFWNNQKTLLSSLFDENNPLIHTLFEIVKENTMKEFIPELVSLTKCNNEIVAFEAISTLKVLNALQNIDKTSISFKNQNLKISFEQLINNI